VKDALRVFRGLDNPQFFEIFQSGRLTVRIEKVNHTLNRGTVQHRIEEVVKM